MIILHQLYTRIAVFWLSSTIRATFFKIRYGAIQHLLFKFFNKKPTAEVYLALNDPYSYMLVQVLPQLAQRFNINFVLRLTYNNSLEMNTEQGMWRKWSIKDANAVAQQYGLLSIKKYPAPEMFITGQQLWILQVKNVAQAIEIFNKTWQNEFTEYYQLSTPVINFQINNQRRQLGQGHYMPATILFAGEWFWGIDRLDHLEQLLLNSNLQRVTSRPYFTKNKLVLSEYEKNTDSTENWPLRERSDELEVYLSLRSPYSYLGLIQAQRLAKHYQLPLKFKLVLPMVMRGATVSQDKMRYILSDALREAHSENITFENFRDPLGQGVINCYQLFTYAEHKNKALAYLLAMFEAVYVNGIDLTHTNNLMDICASVNIDYHEALAFADTNPWQSWQDENQQQLTNMGFWGVPCFKYQNLQCWGQDRLWQIEQCVIEELEQSTIEECV